MIKVYHYTHKNNVDKILKEGLKATSRYEQFTKIRKDVVYCWLSPNDQKIFSDEDVCLEITVDENRCLVADMEYISFAMMYKYGGKKFGGKNFLINPQASDLMSKIYEITTLPITHYDNNFFSPEVLVSGDILPNCIKVYNKF